MCSHMGKLQAHKPQDTSSWGQLPWQIPPCSVCYCTHRGGFCTLSLGGAAGWQRVWETLGFSVRLHGFLGITRKGERAGAQTCVTVFSCSEPINTAASCFFLQHRWGEALEPYIPCIEAVHESELPSLFRNCLAVGTSACVWCGSISLYCLCSEGKFLGTVHLFCSLQLSLMHRTLTSNIL